MALRGQGRPATREALATRAHSHACSTPFQDFTSTLPSTESRFVSPSRLCPSKGGKKNTTNEKLGTVSLSRPLKVRGPETSAPRGSGKIQPCSQFRTLDLVLWLQLKNLPLVMGSASPGVRVTQTGLGESVLSTWQDLEWILLHRPAVQVTCLVPPPKALGLFFGSFQLIF